jgi:transcriptional regulator with XRE-family HTH domain
MLTMATLSEKLKDARRRALMTQTDLAEAAGVGITTIVRIERGQITEPRVSTLKKLAKPLGVDPRTLLED